ncbi:phage tail protein [Rhizomicrobium electricum]|uniref:Tail fiber protein n=1 Tax=Rhizomicrobium electricum TaxID=480070 RepID=A0ABN1F8F9_9PROT|nr:tail fiber protein [Rhizomicrobium electricum]NIJ46720.1 microcystin-dependent protein [Rhizomicrobium electricum]
MSDPYIGQILCAGFDYAPTGYALCNGASMPIMQNQALYSLLGIAYGGSGTNFNLPDLRGRTFFGCGTSPLSGAVYARGQSGGAEAVTLIDAQMPGHQHTVIASSAAGTVAPPGNIYSSVGPVQSGSTYPLYAVPQTVVPLVNPVSTSGGSQSHPSMQPFLVVNFAIATNGYYPQRT